MTHLAVHQQANVSPPIIGEQFALTVDATGRVYDLGGLALGGLPLAASDPSVPGDVFVAIQTDSAGCYLAFSATGAATITTAAVTAAGGTLAKGATVGWPVGTAIQVFRLNRKRHRYLHVIGGAGTLWMRPASEASQ